MVTTYSPIREVVSIPIAPLPPLRDAGCLTIREAVTAAYVDAKRAGMSFKTRTCYRALLRDLNADARPVSAFADACAEVTSRYTNRKTIENARTGLNVVARWLIQHGHVEQPPIKPRAVRCGPPAPASWPDNDSSPVAGYARDWLAHLTASDYAASTVRTYRPALSRMLAGVADLDDLTEAALTARLAQLHDLAPRTRRTYTAILTGFCTWLVERGILAENPAHRLPKPRVRPVAHRYMNEDQAAAVFAACRDDETRMAVRILLGTGLRAAELLSLRWDDVDAAAGEINVRMGKGGKSRIVPAEQETIDVLASYPRRGDRIFPSLSYSALARRVVRLGERAGVPWRLGVHDFRRTFASYFIMLKGDPALLEAVLGHTTVDMSMYYARGIVQQTAVRKARELGIGHALLDARQKVVEPVDADAELAAAMADPRTHALLAAFVRAMKGGDDAPA